MIKICGIGCKECFLLGDKLTNFSKNNKDFLFYNYNYFLENLANKEQTNNKKIVLIKFDNNEIDFNKLIKINLEKINYIIEYKDLEDSISYNKICENIKYCISLNIRIKIFIVCNSEEEIINSKKKLSNIINDKLNFYSNKYIKNTTFKEIIKSKIEDIIDLKYCKKIFSTWNIFFEYKE